MKVASFLPTRCISDARCANSYGGRNSSKVRGSRMSLKLEKLPPPQLTRDLTSRWKPPPRIVRLRDCSALQGGAPRHHPAQSPELHCPTTKIVSSSGLRCQGRACWHLGSRQLGPSNSPAHLRYSRCIAQGWTVEITDLVPIWDTAARLRSHYACPNFGRRKRLQIPLACAT